MAKVMRIAPTLASQAASPSPSRARSELFNALADLAASQKGVVERGQLFELGFTPAQIQRLISQGHLIPLHRGVYAVGHAAVTPAATLLAAVLAVGGISGISRRTAATHLGLWDFPAGDVDVLLAGTGSRRLAGINVHRSRSFGRAHLIEHDGIPTTSVAWTLVDLAGSVGPNALRQSFDAADRRDLIDHDELGYLLHSGAGRRGIGRLQQLAGTDRTQSRRTRSMLELDFLAFCREDDLPEPLINHCVGGYEVDAIWPQSSLVAELDSWEWHRDRDSFERDRAKASNLQAAGLSVIAVTARRLRRERETVAQTLRELIDRGEATSLAITESRRITFG